MSSLLTSPIYFDYAATTPVDEQVAEKMIACLTAEGVFANPASRSHRYGWQAEEKVETARLQVAELLHCDSREIIFTSGATESNNLAIKGVFAQLSGGRFITSTIEHKAVLDPAEQLQKNGIDVVFIKPNTEGVVSTQQVLESINEQTKLVSLMWVNNELGSINPIAEIGALCREKDILFHVDAVQGIGKLSLDVNAMNIDLLSLSAHKFYGPKGIGVLYVRRGIHDRLTAQIHGGGHERGLRSGTLATHQIVGLGAAAELAKTSLENDYNGQLIVLRERLWNGIKDLAGLRRNSSEQTVGSHLNLCFSGIDGETLLLALREIAVSSGSACTSASVDPSYVLTQIGLSAADALSSIRLSLGKYSTEQSIDKAIEHIRKVHAQLAV